jgi:dihydroorotate dehydrogenase (NAD+) catalytic subunit
MIFGTNPSSAREVISAVRKAYSKTLIVKLSPNVTDITEFARISEEEGAEAVSLVNTFLGMAIDVKTMRPKLSTVTGGLSGPAIKPVALRMVWQACQGCQHSCHRAGRHNECGGCTGVHHGRRCCRAGWNRLLH